MQFGSNNLDLSFPHVMGILNVTPDSFSDGGKHNTFIRAVKHANKMIEQGATFIDVGGESTRPGAAPVSVEEELDRVIPVIEALRNHTDCVISVDTSKPQVMKEAVSAGAGLINDVRALQLPGAIEVASDADVPVCLMHMQGQPDSMQNNPLYNNVVDDVTDFLLCRVSDCERAGISADRIILDPGFGFGKTLEHNYLLLKKLSELMKHGFPLLVGMSRKSMIGQLLDRKLDERLAGSIALATIAAQMGAQIFRVHDVQETMDAVRIVKMMREVE